MQPVFNHFLSSFKNKPYQSEIAGLVLSNLITLALIIFSNESLLFVLWIYWFQSILIGLFICLKIIITKRFTTDVNDRINANSLFDKVVLLFTLLIVIVFFHAIYAVFLLLVLPLIFNDMFFNFKLILFAVAAFAVHYTIKFIKDFQNTRNSNIFPNQGSFLIAFFKQILPIHLTIIVAVFVFSFTKVFNKELYANMLVLIFFHLVKTLVEISFYGRMNSTKTPET